MRMERLQRWLYLAPVLLALLVNLNVLQNGFVWDDNFMLSESESALGGPLPQGTRRTYHRPVVEWFWWMDHQIWGQEPFGFHLTNLLLHTAATLLLTVLGLQLFGDHPHGRMTALLAGSLFAVHPVHAEAVAWIAGRNDLLPAVFMLVAMIAHHCLRRGRGGWWAGPLWVAGCGLAALSKESAVPMLLIFPLYDLLIGLDSRPAWRRLLTTSSGSLVLIMMGYFWIRAWALGSPMGEAPLQEGSVYQALLTVLWTLGFYIKHLVAPYPLNAFMTLPPGEGWPQVGLVLVGLAAVVLWIGMTWLARTRLLPLGLWVTLLGLGAPLIVPLVEVTHAPVAERYLYLPTIGFVFVAAAGLLHLGYRCPGRHYGPWVAWTVSLVLVSAFSVGSFLRNSVWRDDRTLWEDTALKSPHAAVPHNLLGLSYRHQGRFEEAAREFRFALQSVGYPETHAMAASNLGGIYYQEHRFDAAEEAFHQALRYQPRLHLAHYNLGLLYWEKFRSGSSSNGMASAEGQRLLAQARQHLIQAVVANPAYANAYYVLGLVNLELGREDRAREAFMKVVDLSPESPFGKDAAQRLAQRPVLQ